MVTVNDTLASILRVRNQRYRRAQLVVRRMKETLINEYHVKRIMLIGSLSDKYRFGFHSDIDLCVEGLTEKDYFKTVGALYLASGEFDIDIIRIEDVSSEAMDRIKRGKVLYEKERNFS